MKARAFSGLVLGGLVVLAGCSAMTGLSGSAATVPEAGMAMSCGQLNITVAPQDDDLLLTVGDDSYRLVPVASASGAKYQLPDDASTSFWSKGEMGLLEADGRTWPECVAKGALTEPFVAHGNEPFWRLSVEGGKLILDEMGGNQATVADYKVTARSAAGRSLESENGARALMVNVAPQLCHDSMSGMAYPYQVRLTVDGESRQGCGGDPARLLQGVEWVVEDIAGGGIIDSSRITINFLAEGRVAGRASCNNFMGGYELTGEGLSFGPAATTMMACAPALMDQERRFLEVLEAVNGFRISPVGALVLETADGRTLRAFGDQSL